MNKSIHLSDCTNITHRESISFGRRSNNEFKKYSVKESLILIKIFKELQQINVQFGNKKMYFNNYK